MRRRSRGSWASCAAAAALALLAGAGAARGQQRPKVGIHFEIAEPTFTREYTPAESTHIAARAAGLLVRRLGSSLGFVALDSLGTGIYQLTFTLARKGPTRPPTPDEVGVIAAVSGPQIVARQLYWLPFRGLEQYSARKPLPDEFVADLQLKLTRGDVERLVRELLSAVPLTRTADLWPSPLGWVLPFKRRDLCIDASSTLLVVSRLTIPGGSRTVPYMADASGDLSQRGSRLLGVARRGQPELDALRRAVAEGHAGVEGVYVVQYLPSALACAAPLTAAEAFPGPGGRP